MWIRKKTVTILDTESISEAIDLGSRNIIAIMVPTGFTGSEITFSVSTDGETYYDLYTSAGVETSITIGLDEYRRLDADIAIGFNHFKLRAGNAAVPTAQSQDVVIELATGTLF